MGGAVNSFINHKVKGTVTDRTILNILTLLFFLGGLFGMTMGFVKFFSAGMPAEYVSWVSEEASGFSHRPSSSSSEDGPRPSRLFSSSGACIAGALARQTWWIASSVQ